MGIVIFIMFNVDVLWVMLENDIGKCGFIDFIVSKFILFMVVGLKNVFYG